MRENNRDEGRGACPRRANWMRCAWIGLLSAMFLLPSVTFAQIDTALRDRTNQGTVGIISGGVNGTYIRFTTDLSAVLDAEDLRLLSVVGKGSVQNIIDLLYLKGIDVAIVQSDVLEFLNRQGTYGSIDRQIQYITKLYNEEVHVLTRREIATVADLNGKRINVDNQGSGTAMTASIVLPALGIDYEPSYHDQSSALAMLKSGEIDALLYVAGQPAQLFTGISKDDGLHLLGLDYTEELQATYLPARLDGGSYPGLIEPGQSVRTVAVGAVMAIYRWQPANARYVKTARFVERFFDRFDEFLGPGRHPKWREVTLSAQVPGWNRFRPAEEWLRASGVQPSTTTGEGTAH
jgi:TRAP transporter TAXI family solute receptor